MMRRMRTSKTGLELIKSFEGFRARAVQLPDSRWTIGYAHTQTARENLRITPADADAVLREYDLPPVEEAVYNAVLAPLNQNEFDALVSFVFNIGEDAFLGSDTLIHLNSGERLAAADAMALWRKAHLNGRLSVIDALVRRRAVEQALFLKHPSGTPIAPSGFIRPVGDTPSVTRKSSLVPNAPRKAIKPPAAPKQTPSPAPKVEAKPAQVAAESSRLTRELGGADLQQKQTPRSNAGSSVKPASAPLSPGPTPDEITRAISALANPDGAPPLEFENERPIVKTPAVQTVAPATTPPPFDEGEEDLPPLPEVDYGNESETAQNADAPLAAMVIDDLEPAEIDPVLLQQAVVGANIDATQTSGIRSLRQLVHVFLGMLGVILGGLGSFHLMRYLNNSVLTDEPTQAFFSIGGIVLGVFLIGLAIYLALRSDSLKA